MILMRMRRRQLLVPAAAVLGLLVPTAPAATAASPPDQKKITGIVQTIIREQPRGKKTDAKDTIKVLRVGKNIVPLTDGDLPTTQDGTTVSVTVVPASDGTNNVLSASTISAPAPAAAAISPVHQVYVALVRPTGVPADASLSDASARAMVSRVSQYWASQTGGKVSFATAAVQSYASAKPCSDTYGMWSEAQARMPAASEAGRHLVVVAPTGADDYGCAYGLGTVGAVESSGNKVFVSGLNQSLLAHELGHNLGLRHSNGLRCGTAQDRPRSGTTFPGCTPEPYDDLFDVMGYSGTNFGEGNLNAVHLDGMNLLPGAIRRIPANSPVTTVRIPPLSAALSTSTVGRTLKVTDPNGANYFVEYRTNSGRDTVASRNYFSPSWGVRVMRDDPAAPPSAGSYELDASPTSLASADYNRAIPLNGTFTAASRSFTIRVTAVDTAGATVTVSYAPLTPAVPAALTQSIPTSALVGAAITATTKVTDQYGQAKANWMVTLYKMQKGTSTWTGVKSLTTNSTGTASHRFANGVSGSYQWRTSPGTGAPTRYSPSVAVNSTARVIENQPATSMTRGGYLAVYGSVSSVPSPVVYIQYRYTGGNWVTGPRATVTGNAVSGRIQLSARSTAYTRLSVRTGASYLGSLSGYYATAVR